MKRAIAVFFGLTMAFAGGCTTYYKVTDPTTGKAYYTTELKQKGSGAATLKDARTGDTVNIQNSEISKISKEEYNTGRNTAPVEAVKPAPNPYK